MPWSASLFMYPISSSSPGFESWLRSRSSSSISAKSSLKKDSSTLFLALTCDTRALSSHFSSLDAANTLSWSSKSIPRLMATSMHSLARLESFWPPASPCFFCFRPLRPAWDLVTCAALSFLLRLVSALSSSIESLRQHISLHRPGPFLSLRHLGLITFGTLLLT